MPAGTRVSLNFPVHPRLAAGFALCCARRGCEHKGSWTPSFCLSKLNSLVFSATQPRPDPCLTSPHPATPPTAGEVGGEDDRRISRSQHMRTCEDKSAQEIPPPPPRFFAPGLSTRCLKRELADHSFPCCFALPQLASAREVVGGFTAILAFTAEEAWVEVGMGGGGEACLQARLGRQNVTRTSSRARPRSRTRQRKEKP